MFSLAAMSVTAKVVGGLVILSLVVGPYLALRYYVPKYKETLALLETSRGQAAELSAKVVSLEKIKAACSAATGALETERKHADDRRRVAEAQAEVLAVEKNKRIANLSAKLSLLQLQNKAKEPVNAEQECVDLKSIVDDYTVVPFPSRMPDSKPAS